ncbi:MAG: DNA repair protein RadA [Oscillospiraceae bacterium]|nr:DNA repair protein RadA [Oscillospiraceae bacterium]
MASKVKTVYVCSVCGHEAPKWTGQCDDCGSWNTMCEQIKTSAKQINSEPSSLNFSDAKTLSQIDSNSEFRFVTKISELDRVLGGGIVKGSVVLLSGDPGIGKSTILLQVCNAFKDTLRILYVSGEESAVQIKMRANRIGVSGDNVTVITETDVQSVCEYIKTAKPDIVMVDSIQTMQIPELSSSAGSIVQVRESTNMLLRVGKTLQIPILIVGHVNKGGDIAGPKVMEHIVDTVLYFEGERNQSYRILRAIKNRFGSTNEIGVFEMTEEGLSEVENPSAMLLSGRMKNVSGDSITCMIEGTRPILAEIQALVTTTGFGNPRRMSTGFDYNRLNLILAVLEKRIGIYFSNLDVYLNVVGGIKIDGTGSDLAVCMALVSAIRDIPLDDGMIAIGEIGLSGELRSVSGIQRRVNEAARLGFTECVLPKSCLKQITFCPDSMKLIGVRNIGEALSLIR